MSNKEPLPMQFARQMAARLMRIPSDRHGVLCLTETTLRETLASCCESYSALVDYMRSMGVEPPAACTHPAHSLGMPKELCPKCSTLGSTPPPDESVKQQVDNKVNAARYLYLRDIATRAEVLELLELELQKLCNAVNPTLWDEYLDKKIADYNEGR